MIQRDNGDGTYSSFDENKPMAPIIEPQMIAAYDQLAATLDSPVKKSVQAAIKAFRAGLSVEDTFVLVMQAIRGFSNDPNILAAISALAIVRWAQQWLDEEQTPEVMRKYSHTYYRSLTPDGKLWCESRNPVEVRAQKHPTKKLTYEKYIVHEVSDGWMPWEVWTR